jgi:hypothetical protein
MKTIPKFLKVALLLFPFTFFLVQAFAQAPEKFNYQAVCRDSVGNIIANQSITLRFNINDLSPGGTSLYQETQTVTTNAFGLVNVEIGYGTWVSGNFLTIPWESGEKYLKVELNTGTGFNIVGTPQLLSVPYAIYANKSGTPGVTGPTGPTGPLTPGTNGQTLRNNGTDWIATSTVYNNGTNIGIGTTTPDASAKMDISSTTSGLLIPRMSMAERNAIVSPATGLIIYNTDCSELQFFNGSGWASITSGNTIAPPVTSAPTAVTCNSFTANWLSSPGATTYLLDVATDALFTSFLAGYNNLNVGAVTSRIINGLPSSTTYYYRIRAVFSVCPTGSSNIQMAITGPPMPPALDALGASNIGSSSFTAHWSSEPTAIAYFLDVSKEPLFVACLSGFNNLNVGLSTQFPVTGLGCDSTYYYRVRYSNNCGTSLNSDTISVTTIGGNIYYRDADEDMYGDLNNTINACSLPDGYVTNHNDCDDSDPQIHPGVIEKCGNFVDDDCDGQTDEFWCPPRSHTSETCEYPNVCVYTCLPGWFDLDGIESTGCESDTPPAPVATAATHVETDNFDATWSAVDGVEGYFLDVSDDISFSTFIIEDMDMGNNLDFVVMGLSSNTTYYYRVRAYYTPFSSASSNVITVVTNL